MVSHIAVCRGPWRNCKLQGLAKEAAQCKGCSRPWSLNFALLELHLWGEPALDNQTSLVPTEPRDFLMTVSAMWSIPENELEDRISQWHCSTLSKSHSKSSGHLGFQWEQGIHFYKYPLPPRKRNCNHADLRGQAPEHPLQGAVYVASPCNV